MQLRRFFYSSLVSLVGWAAAAHSESLAPPLPSAGAPPSLLLAFECASFESNPREHGGDCQSGPILIQKAFFDRALGPRLKERESVTEDIPAFSVKTLVYRRGTPKPGGPEGLLEWSYRGLLFWSVRETLQGPVVRRGFLDVDSGRRFEGPAGRGYQAADLRTVILQAAAGELAERTQEPLKSFARARSEGPLQPSPAVKLEAVPALKGACASYLGSDEMKKSLSEMALEVALQTAARPELSGLEGPWRARLSPCTEKSDELSLFIESRKARAKSKCALRDSVLAGESTGILGQCAVIWLGGLRAELLGQLGKSGG